MPPQFQSSFIPKDNTPISENNPTQNIPEQKLPRKNGFLITLTFLLVLTGIFGVWYFSNPLPEEDDMNGSTLLTINKFAGWKTYRNEEYGFEFKYPTLNTDIKINKNLNNLDSNLVFTYLDQLNSEYYNTFGFFIENNKNKSTLQKWFQDNVDKNNSLINSNNFELIEVPEGGQMYRLSKLPISSDYNDGPVSDFYIMSPDNKYVFVFNLHEDRKVNMKDYTNKILSTFKFISTSTTITWNSENEAEFSGYYIQNQREWLAGTVTCDSFVVTNSNYLVDYYKGWVLKGNSVNTLDSNGNLIINLEFHKLNQETVQRIKNSNKINPVLLSVKKKIEVGKGAPECFSFIDILSVK